MNQLLHNYISTSQTTRYLLEIWVISNLRVFSASLTRILIISYNTESKLNENLIKKWKVSTRRLSDGVFFCFCRRNFNISAVRPSGANIFLLSPALMRADKRWAGDNRCLRSAKICERAGAYLMCAAVSDSVTTHNQYHGTNIVSKQSLRKENDYNNTFLNSVRART